MKSLLLRSFRGYRRIEDAGTSADNELLIGSLLYTRPGLLLTVLASGWGLLGFFLMTNLFGTFVPVEMKRLGSSDSTIAFFVTTVPYIFNMVITPWVSFRSDRLRTRWGRRMPYILLPAPLIMIFLILIGFTPEVAAWLRAYFSGLPEWTPIALLGVFAVGYQIFYMMAGTIIYYLYPDVIPQKFIGRFMAIFSLIGSLAGFLFSRYLLPLGEFHMGWLFLGIAVFYVVAIFTMAPAVREGSYPPVPPEVAIESAGLRGAVKTYVRECYSVPYYYAFFIAMALNEVSLVCRTMFNMIYATNTLGLSYLEFGIAMGWAGLAGVILSYPIGILIDRINALRVFALGLGLVCVVNLGSFFWVSGYESFLVTTLLLGVVYTIQNASGLPVFVAVLPKAQYGQFCSANALLRALFMAVAGYGGGLFMEWVGSYQYIYLWDFAFTLTALIAFVVLYRNWRKRGGPDHYQAPVRI